MAKHCFEAGVLDTPFMSIEFPKTWLMEPQKLIKTLTLMENPKTNIDTTTTIIIIISIIIVDTGQTPGRSRSLSDGPVLAIRPT